MMTKTLKLALAGLVLAAGSLSVQAADPAPRNIDLQSVMVDQCVKEATTLKVLDARTANKVCTCTVGVQARELKLGEFWAIQSSAMSGKDPRTNPATQSIIGRLQPKLAQCQQGVKFNQPTLPAAPAPKR